MSIKAPKRGHFDTLEVIDASIFVEAMWEREHSQAARALIYELRTSNTRLPATTHEVLGEVMDVLRKKEYIDGDTMKLRDAKRIFRRCYDKEHIFLLTPHPSDVCDAVDTITDRDRQLAQNRNYTDCGILAKAIARNADKIHTLDADWSLGGLIKVVKLSD